MGYVIPPMSCVASSQLDLSQIPPQGEGRHPDQMPDHLNWLFSTWMDSFRMSELPRPHHCRSCTNLPVGLTLHLYLYSSIKPQDTAEYHGLGLCWLSVEVTIWWRQNYIISKLIEFHSRPLYLWFWKVSYFTSWCLLSPERRWSLHLIHLVTYNELQSMKKVLNDVSFLYHCHSVHWGVSFGWFKTRKRD